MRFSVVLVTLLAIPLCAVSVSGRQAEASLGAARERFRAGEMKSAAELYLQAIKTQPESVEAHVQLIRTLLELGDLQNAAAASAAAGAALPDSASVVAAMGDVLYRVGKFTEASQAYRRALELDPSHARASWGTGRIQKLSKNGKQAKESFIRAYELDPQDPDIVLSWAETRETSLETAAALERADELAPYRTRDYRDQLLRNVASLRYLGGRNRCELIGPPAKATLSLDRRDVLPTGLPGLSLPISPEYRIGLKINGKDGRFNFDVTGSDLVIYERSAKRLGVIQIAGSAPSNGMYRGFAERVTLGKMEFRNCLVDVVAFNNPLVSTLMDRDGVIGGQLLAGFLLTLKKNSLILDPLPTLAPGETERWSDARMVADSQNFTPLLDAGPWLVMASVGGNPPMLFGLSAAGNVSYVTRALGLNLKLQSNPPPPITGCRENCIDIEVGGRKARTQLRIMDVPRRSHPAAVELAGVLASDFLYQFTISIDFRNGLLRLD